MISIRTNVDAMNAANNLKVNSSFQSKTIQRLTSGYRINNSGDDAAGLATANGYRTTVTELTQGVANANQGLSQLQIVDGGLSNISTILDRMKTLATQSASGTFAGNRTTVNQEYQQLISEITRQASNINLNVGGSLNTNLSVYIGGANSTNNAGASIDLSGASAVDAASLGLTSTSVQGSGIGFNNNTTSLTAPGAKFLTTGSAATSQTFSFNVFANGSAQTVTATVTGASAAGSTLNQVLSSLNSQLGGYGINAQVDSNGYLQFSGSNAFVVTDSPLAAGNGSLTNESVTADKTSLNNSNFTLAGKASFTASLSAAETLTFKVGTQSVSVAMAGTETLAQAISKINTQTAQYGLYAVSNNGAGISFQSSNSFSAASSVASSGILTTAAANTYQSSADPTAAANTSNAQAAITSINSAIQALGLVQGRVGAGENKLQYAISLAQSQIASFSAAESQIRDADVAQEAANLTKAQVLQQTSIAAMAQANQEPQAVLKLLQ